MMLITMALTTLHAVKYIYIFAAIAFESICLPFFIVKYSFSYGRQHSRWTLRQAITVRSLYRAVYHMGNVRITPALSLKPGSEKDRFVIMSPSSGDLYTGPLRSNKDVEPTDIGGTWYPSSLGQQSDRKDVKVILHLHGGAFVMGDGRPQLNNYFANQLLKHTTATHVFCPQYRLSALPVSRSSNPFPAALQDTLTTYLYLINNLGISSKDIILSGDSAGGNLAISLLRYIAEYGSDLKLPHPSALLLWSPWINPGGTSRSYVYDNENFNTDYVALPYLRWGSAAYAGLPGPSTLSQPYISHKEPFITDVPIYVNVGGFEILCHENAEWIESMKEAGNTATFYVEKNVPHDSVLMAQILGFEEEGVNSVKQAGEWIQRISSA
jgi:acetyl esterase/lipase